MKTIWIPLLIAAVPTAMASAQAANDMLTNHAAAVTFLDEYERLTGANFNANLPFQDHYHFEGGRKLLAYMEDHRDDTNVAQRVTTLAKSWANMERANKEMEQDKSSRLAHLWFTRTLFAWTVLIKQDAIREGMTYADAVELLGRPRNHHDAFDSETEVMWVLGGGLHTQTWIKAKLSPDGTILSLKIRRT